MLNSRLCVRECVCVCLHFLLIRIFADMQNFNHASHVRPLAIVCVHQAKCWLRMKGLFPSAFNESVCCMLTKRPTPIHLDFLHVFFFSFCRAHLQRAFSLPSLSLSRNWCSNVSSTMKNTVSPGQSWLDWFILSQLPQGTYSLKIGPSIPT